MQGDRGPLPGPAARWSAVFDAPSTPSSLVPSARRALLDNEPFERGRPDDVLDFPHVDDVAGTLAALVASPVTGDVNIASGRPVSVGELCGRIAAKVGRPKLNTYRAGNDDRSVVTAATSRLFDEVGWRLTLSLDEGIDATIDWWFRDQVVSGAQKGMEPGTKRREGVT